MNPIERALGILLLLTSGKLVTATSLAERFEVSLRTIYRDVDRLLALGIPVEAERGAEGGYRLARGYLQAPIALTRNETAALITALELVSSIQTMPLGFDLHTAEQKLLASLPPSVHDLLSDAGRIIGAEPTTPDVFHAVTEPEETEHWQAAIDGFMEGLLSSRRVMFEHHNPARSSARSHEVEPCGLLFERTHWYLAGWSLEAEEIRLYRADRIRNLEVTGFRFRPHKDFRIADMLGGHWLSAAMRRWEKEDGIAVLRVTAEQAERLQHDWYYRHALFTPAGEDVVEIRLPETRLQKIQPLIRWLGPGAEVVSPASLRSTLAEELLVMARQHGAVLDETTAQNQQRHV